MKDKEKDKETSLKSAWHLAKTNTEANITELEFLIWQSFYSFRRWQEDCQQCVNDDDVSADEIGLMHIIRIHGRPKTIYELARILNRDDMSNMQYSLKKLLKLGIINKTKGSSNKLVSYGITERGIEITDKYSEIRRSILIDMLAEIKQEEWDILHKVLRFSKNAYDEAARLVSIQNKRFK